jgi:DNA-binding CsgD family transcriptional regulator
MAGFRDQKRLEPGPPPVEAISFPWESMRKPVDVLEQIAKSDDAVFAFDANDLVILWNKGCERLLGRPAYEVLGRHCYDIMCGRDAFGNMYCCPSCPITIQARTRKDQPVQRFELDVNAGGNRRKKVSITTFALPAVRSGPATLVHVLREPGAGASQLETDLAAAVEPPAESRPAPRAATPLTKRELEILRLMARGTPTSVIADQMFIAPVTVRNHIARILQKLDVHSKLAAVAFAYRNRLIPAESAPLPTRRG